MKASIASFSDLVVTNTWLFSPLYSWNGVVISYSSMITWFCSKEEFGFFIEVLNMFPSLLYVEEYASMYCVTGGPDVYDF